MKDDFITILSQLETFAAEHEMQVEYHRVQAGRYREAIRALNGIPVSRGKKRGAFTTMSMVRSELAKSPTPLSVNELVQHMLEGGWVSSTRFPQNAVRTALLRLIDKGEVRRREDGTFLTKISAPIPVAESTEASSTEAKEQ